MGLIAAWILPVLLGHAALAALADAGARTRVGATLRWATAIPLGLGVSSLVAFAAAAAFGKSLLAVTLAEGTVLALLVGVARRRDARAATPSPATVRPAPRWLAAMVAIGLACATASFVAQARALPFGDADGIAIWGNRAIFLLRAFGDWPLVFSPQLVHTDYPLLLPIALARAWLHGSGEPPLAGVLLAATFTACTFAALGASLARLRDGTLGALATLALCATPFFAVQGAGQTGDVPLACYALLACVWLRIGGTGALPLAGCCAWLGAWTKNEGLLIAGVLTLVLLIGSARRDGVRAAASTARGWLLGAAPAIAAIAAFKLCLAPRNDLLANHGLAKILPMLADAERWRLVAGAFLEQAVWLRGAGAAAGCGPVALLGFALLFGRAHEVLGRETITVFACAVGVFLVFLLSPYDLRWHLGTALDRVLLQLWPLALFGVLRGSVPTRAARRAASSPRLDGA